MVSYFFRLPGDQPFAFAGLWDRWEGADHPVLETLYHHYYY